MLTDFGNSFTLELYCKSVTKMLLWIPPQSKRLALVPTLSSYHLVHLPTLPLYHFTNLPLCNNLFISFDTTASSAYCQPYSFHSKLIARRSACNRDQRTGSETERTLQCDGLASIFLTRRAGFVCSWPGESVHGQYLQYHVGTTQGNLGRLRYKSANTNTQDTSYM